MTAPDSPEADSDREILSANLRGIRHLRGLSSAETAAGMNLALRTYQDFESGRGRLNMDYIHRFCRFVDADPDAIIASLAIGSPDFAVRCASNKLMRIVMIGVQQLNRQLGDRISTLEARTVVAAVNAGVRDLLEAGAGEDTAAWIEEGEEALRRARPRPGR